MATQVGVGEVAIVPTIKGFRRAVEAEVDSTTKQAKGAFEKGFASAGTKAGTDSGKGFHQAFSGNTKTTVADLTKSIERDVAKASREVSNARLREQDAAGKVRVAESQLAEVRAKYSRDSSQVVRAEERLEAASRNLADRQGLTKQATERLKDSQGKLAAAAQRVEDEMRQAGQAADRAGSEFRDAAGDANESAGEMSSAGAAGATGFLGSMRGGLGQLAGVVGAALVAANIAGTVGDFVGNAVTDGLRTAFELVSDSVGIASGLEQSVAAVDSVFKDNSATIQAWADGAAESVGLSKGKYQEFATVVGAQLKNLGLPMDEVTNTTGDLIGLGSDLAAQFGGETSDAVSALSSLLRGERDPIERYGVSIRQADIDARLAAKGLGDLEGEARKNAEIAETLGLLYEQTADAQGTFADRSDTLAGKQQILAAKFENAKGKLGESLLPALTTLANFAADELMPIIEDVIEEIGPELGKALQEAAPYIADLAEEFALILPDLVELGVEALPVLVEAFKIIVPFLVDAAEATGDFFGTIGNLLGLLTGNRTLDEFGKEAAGAGGEISLMSILTGGASGSMLGSLEQIIAGALRLGEGIGRGVGKAIEWIQSLPRKAREALSGAGSWLVESGQALIQGFIDGIRGMIDSAGNAVATVVDWVRGFFPNSPAKRGPLSGAGWSRLAGSGEAYMQQWVGGIENGARGFSLPGILGEIGAMTMNLGSNSAPTPIAAGGRGATVYVEVPVHQTDMNPTHFGRMTGRAIADELVGVI